MPICCIDLDTGEVRDLLDDNGLRRILRCLTVDSGINWHPHADWLLALYRRSKNSSN